MIYLFTGKPGAGKTLNAINYVLTDSVFNVRDEDGKDVIEDGKPVKRPVYYFNIKEVTHPWNELTLDEVLKWYELPVGSVIFIDECQDVFTGVQRNNAAPPLYSELNKHRHHGYDLVLVTQAGSLLTSIVRPLVDRHVHLENETGSNKSKWIEKGSFIDNPAKKSTREQCNISIRPYPKHIFGTYKSAEIHTKKFRMPDAYKYIIVVAVLFFSVSGYAYYHFTSKIAPVETPKETQVNPPSKANIPSSTVVRNKDGFKPLLPMDPQEYLAMTQPRIAGLPHTAPLYDSFITSPASSPKTICYGFQRNGKYKCKCVTEQNTSLSTPHNTCVNIVNNGMYDVTLSSNDQ
jgi:zona occludens toxin (predicted ATPase)